MAKHLVICKVCGKQFDTNKEEAILIGNRYAHKSCLEKINSEEQELKSLEDYIKHMFNKNSLDVSDRKQLLNFKKDYNYTYGGMLKTLIFYYEILNHSIKDTNTVLGIIPYYYDRAYKYYYNKFIIENKNKEKISKGFGTDNVKTIIIHSPKSIKTINLFDLG